MRRTVIAVLATLLSMGLLDAFWLATMTTRLYRRELGSLLLERPQWALAVTFYLLYAVGVLGLVALPALERDWPLLRVVLMGALLGTVAYGTYDLTNQATLRGWSPLITVVDMTWGAALTATAASLAVLIARQFES